MRPGSLSLLGSADGRGRGARGLRALAPSYLRGCAPVSKGERDDGGLAGTYGASAGKPSAPGTYGGLVWNNPAGRGSTRGEDSTGRDEDAARRAARAARFAADSSSTAGRDGGRGAGGGVNQRTETVQAEAGSGGAGVARAGGMDEVDAGRRGGGGLRAVLGGGGRIDSWPVLAFGAKWIISGQQRVRCGRPACITNA